MSREVKSAVEYPRICNMQDFKENLFPWRINDFMQLASMVNVLLAEVILHTGLLFEAYLS